MYTKLKPKFKELLVDQKAKSVEFELIKAIVTYFDAPEHIDLRTLALERL